MIGGRNGQDSRQIENVCHVFYKFTATTCPPKDEIVSVSVSVSPSAGRACIRISSIVALFYRIRKVEVGLWLVCSIDCSLISFAAFWLTFFLAPIPLFGCGRRLWEAISCFRIIMQVVSSFAHTHSFRMPSLDNFLSCTPK